MTEHRKDIVYLSALLALLIIFFSKILFTAMLVRAPDISNEFYWTVKGFKDMGFLDLFRVNLHPSWDPLVNGGTSEGGGTLSMQFLFYRNLIFWLIPEPANIAWFMVLHLFFGSAGTYLCCRAVGCGRIASLLGGVIFAIAPENASLINAGHAQKIATISFAPWAFYFLEKGFQSRRTIHFLTVGLVLAFQFFNMHWQIAYYTCLGIAVYASMRMAGIYLSGMGGAKGGLPRLLGLNVVTLLFFLSTVAISLVPLSQWSRETTRGVQSGANQGRGGLDVDEAMSWSMPPEEAVTFLVPGFFGFSRQEAPRDDSDIESFYWGRMVFTQTSDYMGLLPWLLLPLPLLFRRDVFTWSAVAAVAGGILFSMGRYTPFYWFLYDHFPGINHFRVPKMMMFLPVLGLSVLAARGMEIILDGGLRKSLPFRRYLLFLIAFPLLPMLLLLAETAGREFWLSTFYSILEHPSRFQHGTELVMQRWNNLVGETAMAGVLAGVYGLTVYFSVRKERSLRWLPLALLLLYCIDAGRVDYKFMVLQDMPEKARGVKSPVMEYLGKQPKGYRTLPLNGSDPMQYVSNGIPVMFTANAVQQVRWQNFIDAFTLDSPMPDMMNVRYLVCSAEQYEKGKGQLGEKYLPLPEQPGGGEVLLVNSTVLPKGWLVPRVAVISDPIRVLRALQYPRFDPGKVALVEREPPIPMAADGGTKDGEPGEVTVSRYESNRISADARCTRNSLLVLGEKYFQGWKATVDGRAAQIHPVNHILRGVYLAPGDHRVEFIFDPFPFKVGKWLTLASLLFYAIFLGREIWLKKR